MRRFSSDRNSSRLVRRRLFNRNSRAGVAATEAALCLPLIVILTFASIEACDAIFLSHSLHVAGYETIRVAVQPKSKNADADAMASTALADHNVVDATVTYEPSDISAVDRGQPITVTISAPVESNTILPSWFFTNHTLSAQVTMVKE